jgi:rhodanese-related sulfurtransferase
VLQKETCKYNKEVTACEANKFLSTPSGGHRTIYAQALVDDVDDPNNPIDDLEDFFLMDIRLPADYCAGHIPGAVNIPFLDVAKPENLAMLPIDRPILVICYTGHTASQINAILNMLGYNAWTLRFGMTSWRDETSTAVWSSDASYKQIIYGGNHYPVDSFPMEICP